jgi:DNA transformation protein
VAVNQDYLQFIHEQLAGFGDFESKKMFGGVGFFAEGIMFGMISKGILRFRVDETNQANYEARGMTKWQPNPSKKGMPYWEVPVEVLEDKSALAAWATTAFGVAVKLSKKK